ncbi:MAG: hypothetical protein QOI95_4419 [Acidimicrobiaceae bacterium]|jgi:cytochrome P450
MSEPVLQRAIDESLHDGLRQARAASPTAIDADTGAVVVLRYAEVERLAHDPRVLGVGLSFFDFMGIGDSELRRWYGSLMFTNEGEPHHRLRRLVARAFTPRSVERHRAWARQLASEKLSQLADIGEGDLVDLFADLPIAVICRLLGVPDGEVGRFVKYGDALSPVFGLMTAEQIQEASDALVELTVEVDRIVAERSAHRDDDLISDLLDAEEDGDRLTREELVTMVGNLIVGGHDTTASQIHCTLLTLLRHPDSLHFVRDGEASATDIVNETIRFEPSIPFVPRTLAEPVDIGGVERPAGSLVFLSTASANRDDSVWDDPETFRPQRFAQPDAPRLLSFGSGPHYCLGAALARMTLEEVVATFAEPSRELAPLFDLDGADWREVLGRSPAALPVTRRG